MVRIVITGAGGQVGREVVELCTAAGDDVTALDHHALDVGDRDAVLQCVLAARPSAVVHAAAWTAVDACEANQERAFRDNTLGARHVAEASARAGAHLVYLSTDYVFDGILDVPYTEWDTPNPCSVYGRSKLAGEQEVARLCGPNATTVRTSWVLGRHGSNMVKTVLRLAATQERVAFVGDQRGHPTLAADLAGALRRFAVGRYPGLFHVTNQGAVSWYELACDVFGAAGLDPSRVREITTAELDPPRPAARPANSVLDNAALRLSGLPVLDDHRGGLRRLVAEVSAMVSSGS